MTSNSVEPMMLSEVLSSTPVKKTKKPKLPGAPKAKKIVSVTSRVGGVSRTLFPGDIVHLQLDNPKTPSAPKKPKKAAKKSTGKNRKLPTTLYLVLDPQSKPVSVHATELSANKRYWKECALHGSGFTIHKTQSDNS